MNPEIFSQSPYGCRLDWGEAGVQRVVGHSDIIVIVDTLSFSTTVAVGVSRGAMIYPCSSIEELQEIAHRTGGERAVGRHEVPAAGRYSLSPQTLTHAARGERIVLRSPNGATLSRMASSASHVLAGALVNARYVADVLNGLLAAPDRSVTVIACGEREKETGGMRVAIEDYLGAGAIIEGLSCTKSPEATLAGIAFAHARAQMAALLWDCGSGRELRAMGFGEDVTFASAVDSIAAVPVLRNGCFTAYHEK
jgi:2-phosphosulfolactate phosphatase